MKTVAADATGVPTATRLVLAFGILLSVTAFPTRFRIVILERKHSQPQSNERSNDPTNWGNDTPTLVPYDSTDGKKNVDDGLQENRGEMEQQTELKKLDIGTKHVPDILKAKGVIDSKMPSRGIADVFPSSFIVNESQVSFSLVIRTSSSVGHSIVSGGPRHSLRAPLECLSVQKLGHRHSGCRMRLLPTLDA